MCKFFSFITVPDEKKYYYFDWKQRVSGNHDETDSHSKIIEAFCIKNEAINAWEYNPLTRELVSDCMHGKNDTKQVKKWVNNLDFKTIVEPLIIKPIVNPLLLPKIEVPTEEQIELLKKWASVGDSVGDSVGASVWAYIGSFFNIAYDVDISSSNKLWESGIVSSFDGKLWRLHSGKYSSIIYTWNPKE